MRNLLVLLLAASCSGLFGQTTLTTESGHRMVIHRKSSASAGKPGDAMMINAITTIGDSVMMNTQRDFGGPRELVLPDKASLKGQKVPAILEAAFLLGKGDSATLYQAIDSVMRTYLPPTLQKAKEIRFDLSIVDVVTAEQKAAAAAAAQAQFDQLEPKIKATVADFVAGKLDKQLTALPSGLKMLVVEKGKGAAIKKGESVSTHYYGILHDGSMFDNSFQRGEPLGFQVGAGQMIAGFDEGVQQLQHGAKAYLFLPYQLAYGEEGGGPIPAKADLVFYIEVQ
ncbi:MAG TPA: FKBP-type peptidyl-prolyl cis-trans isomerase [Saprospiraceae bacterium]|nr:FKBP-type peptidyl-prolyl cis-trans isomerase [Saprospiraceae bacterium]HND89535.1 FKBP-type peptidyl-prolyl cis-trans isomerase [Saprospiraceae bacterium]